MLRPAFLALALVAWATLPAVGQQPPQMPRSQQGPQPPQPPADDPIGRRLFPPELVMRHQQEIALAAEQRTAITKAIQEFQNRTVDLQWQLQDQTQRLDGLLIKPSVDEAVALQQLDQLLNVEREVKRAHIGLLIKIKNTLTAEQQDKLLPYRE